MKYRSVYDRQPQNDSQLAREGAQPLTEGATLSKREKEAIEGATGNVSPSMEVVRALRS